MPSRRQTARAGFLSSIPPSLSIAAALEMPKDLLAYFSRPAAGAAKAAAPKDRGTEEGKRKRAEEKRSKAQKATGADKEKRSAVSGASRKRARESDSKAPSKKRQKSSHQSHPDDAMVLEELDMPAPRRREDATSRQPQGRKNSKRAASVQPSKSSRRRVAVSDDDGSDDEWRVNKKESGTLQGRKATRRETSRGKSKVVVEDDDGDDDYIDDGADVCDEDEDVMDVDEEYELEERKHRVEHEKKRSAKSSSKSSTKKSGKSKGQGKSKKSASKMSITSRRTVKAPVSPKRVVAEEDEVVEVTGSEEQPTPSKSAVLSRFFPQPEEQKKKVSKTKARLQARAKGSSPQAGEGGTTPPLTPEHSPPGSPKRPGAGSKAASHALTEQELDRAATEALSPKRKSKKRSDSAALSTDSASSSAQPATSAVSRGASSTSSFRSYMQRGGPTMAGMKEIPVGAPNCLNGKHFIITGVLDSLERDDAFELIKQYGGKVAKSVAKACTHAIVGRDPGLKKMEKIEERKLPILDEDGLLDMIRTSKAQPLSAQQKQKIKELERVPTVKPTSPRVRSPVMQAPEAAVAAKRGTSTAKKRLDMDESKQREAPVSSLWSDKYRPATSNDLVGNPTMIQKLKTWLGSWEVKWKNKVAKTNDDKAVLLSGPPGIGKTSAAHAVSRDMGYEVIEFNASDTRSKNALKEHVATLTGNKSLSAFYKSDMRTEVKKKTVLIMDEVDGMSGGDRGGMAELIQLIKQSRVPIICICNDRQSQKVRSLRNYCLELSFRKPTPLQAQQRLRGIAKNEGLTVDAAAMQRLFTMANNDFRQVLNMLQMYRLRKTVLTVDDLAAGIEDQKKNVTLGLFEVLPRLLPPEMYSKTSLQDKISLYFVDHSIVPLMVHENYASCRPIHANKARSPQEKEWMTLEALSRAAESISDGDLVDTQIHQQQTWSVAPLHGVLSTVAPCFFMQGHRSRMDAFPTWLGKTSTKNKNYRVVNELRSHVSRTVTATAGELRMDYLEALKVPLYLPLMLRGQEGIESVINTMDLYGLSREDFDSIADLIHLGGKNKPTLIRDIPAKVKSAFTRAYNKQTHELHAVQRNIKRGSSAAVLAEQALEGDESADALAMEEEEVVEDDGGVENDPMVKRKAHKPGRKRKRQ